MTRLKGTLASVAILAVWAQVSADERLTFEELDLNGDGKISSTEAGKTKAIDFGRADLNRDGYISRREFERTLDRVLSA